jgi:hypothetical protein
LQPFWLQKQHLGFNELFKEEGTMHEFDRTQPESELDALESEQFEYAFEEEAELDGEADTESPFNETDEMELAASLLEVSDEAELDQFLGNLIKKAGSAVGQFVRSPTGRALGGILKGAARKALPIAGRAIGSYFGGPTGGAIGGRLASTAGKLFGLELEGLSGEDQEFEVAKRFVRFAGTAAKKAATTPPTVAPQAAARSAVVAAARRFAPGLVRGGSSAVGPVAGRLGRRGRWVRRGRNIIIVNC